MKQLFIALFLIQSIVTAQPREKEIAERVDYLKSNPIFVTQLTLDEKAVKKLSKEQIEDVQRITDKINQNTRIAFNSFWDISDTIIFIAHSESKTRKKEVKGGIFFELISLGEYTENAQPARVAAFHLSRPNRDGYFNNVSPRLAPDTSLVDIISELRVLKQNVVTGDVFNRKDLGRKLILINKDERRNAFAESYVKSIRSKYAESVIDVDYNTLLGVIMRKDPDYIYVLRGSTINAEDGAMLPLQ